MSGFNRRDDRLSDGGSQLASPAVGAIALVAILAVIAVGVFVITRGGDDEGGSTPVANSTSTGSGGSILELASPTTTTAAASTAQATAATTAATTPTTTTQAEQPTTAAEDPTEPTDDGTTDEEEIDPTEEPVDTEPEPTPTPTEPSLAEVPEAPSDGDFGALPPAQLTSGNLTRNLEFTYALNVDLAAMPSSGTVYQLGWSLLDEASAAAVVAAVLPDGVLSEQGEGWHAEGSTGSISLQPGSVQYVGLSPEPGTLPDDDSAVVAASDWLLASGLVGGNVGEAVVIARDEEFGRAVVQVKPAEPAPVLAFLPSATVTIGPGGSVVEANVRWPSEIIPADYTLRDPNAVWNDVLAGRGSIEADLSQLSNSGALSAEIGVDEVTLAWSYASGENGEFLVPVIAMYGTLTMLETGEQIPASIYLPALTSEDAAQG